MECEGSAQHLVSLETSGLCITYMYHVLLFIHIRFFLCSTSTSGVFTLQEIASLREMHEFGVATLCAVVLNLILPRIKKIECNLRLPEG